MMEEYGFAILVLTAFVIGVLLHHIGKILDAWADRIKKGGKDERN